MARVTFLLPWAPLTQPIGGFKVAFTYANGLALRGHDVSIVQPATDATRGDLRGRAKAWLTSRRPENPDARPNWFSLDERVNCTQVATLSNRHMKNSDAVIATAWQTAEYASTYSATRGRRFYLVYDYEYYMTARPAIRARMNRTYRADFVMLAPSPIIRDVLYAQGVNSAIDCPNGVELDLFGLDMPIDSNNRRSIGFSLRPEPFKGGRDAVAAVSAIRERFGDAFDYWCFGWNATDYLPGWVRFHRLPDNTALRGLYNRTSVFLVSSHFEGFGLPGAEAMACGAALVSTDNGGCRAYAEHNRTALLSPPADPSALAANALQLLENQASRIRLASAGLSHIQAFAWSGAIDRFDSILQTVLARSSSRFEEWS